MTDLPFSFSLPFRRYSFSLSHAESEKLSAVRSDLAPHDLSRFNWKYTKNILFQGNFRILLRPLLRTDETTARLFQTDCFAFSCEHEIAIDVTSAFFAPSPRSLLLFCTNPAYSDEFQGTIEDIEFLLTYCLFHTWKRLQDLFQNYLIYSIVSIFSVETRYWKFSQLTQFHYLSINIIIFLLNSEHFSKII